jgi:hypothetical protein
MHAPAVQFRVRGILARRVTMVALLCGWKVKL